MFTEGKLMELIDDLDERRKTMEAYVEKVITVKIKMTDKEARWLKGYMQNALISNETSKDAAYRKEIFNILDKAGIE